MSYTQMTPAREGAVSFPRPGAARGHIDPASSCAPLVDELCTHLAQCCIFSEKEAGKREGGCIHATVAQGSIDLWNETHGNNQTLILLGCSIHFRIDGIFELETAVHHQRIMDGLIL